MTFCCLFDVASLMNKIELFFLVTSCWLKDEKETLYVAGLLNVLQVWRGWNLDLLEKRIFLLLWRRRWCCFLFLMLITEEVVFWLLYFHEKFIETKKTLNCWIIALLFFKIFYLWILWWTACLDFFMLTGTRLMLQILLSPSSLLLPFLSI